MELIVLIGIQGSGKSTFCNERFRDTHVRINMDMLRTRHREMLLFSACLEAKQPVVIDNTNPTRKERLRYIELAKAKGFRVVGYYFAANLEACKTRNAQRPAERQVPLPGLLGTYTRLELPARNEGWDSIYYVRPQPDMTFEVQEWHDDV